MTDRKTLAWMWISLAAIAAVLITYSQTLSLTWDEGYHLVAAQMIKAGKRPYIDFCFPQTPLNAYWVALLIRIFGQTWHTVHAAAAIESTIAAALMGDYLLRRFPLPEWRFTAVVSITLLVGLNVAVVEYGTLGQAYGICLMLSVLAFRLAVSSVSRGSILLAALAGLAAGGSAMSSLLTVTLTPILFIWLFLHRRSYAFVFFAGAFVACIPILYFLAIAREMVLFDILRYHLFFRQVEWDGWFWHDLTVFTAIFDCFHALVLGALAAIGFFSMRGWDPQIRSEFRLAGCLAVIGSAYIMTAHPTFERYFLLIAPFAGISAAAAIPVVLKRMGLAAHARWPIAVFALILSVTLARALYDDRDDNWHNIEPIAEQVAKVTPPNAVLYADEHVYFLLNRLPYSGMECNSTHKVDLPMSKAAPLHVLPRAELVRRVKAGVFDTLETCGQGEAETMGLDQIYSKHAEVKDCLVYWDRKH